MSHYLVRIELRNYNPEDQAAVEKLMTEAGFSRTIVNQDGTYLLPTGNFHIFSDSSFHDIYEKAGQAADQPNKPFGIVMAEVSLISFYGLKKAAPYDLARQN